MTTEIEVLDFEADHVNRMDIRDLETESIFTLGDIGPRMDAVAEVSDFACTVLYKEKILACAGLSLIWPGVANSWRIPSKDLPKHSIVFARFVARNLSGIIKVYGIHRLQTVAAMDDLHTRWLSWLDFELEGVLNKYTHQKKDRGMWARIVD